jgi:hypothetical protein
VAEKPDLTDALKTLAETLNWPVRAVPQLVAVLDALADHWDDRPIKWNQEDEEEKEVEKEPEPDLGCDPGDAPLVDPIGSERATDLGNVNGS